MADRHVERGGGTCSARAAAPCQHTRRRRGRGSWLDIARRLGTKLVLPLIWRRKGGKSRHISGLPVTRPTGCAPGGGRDRVGLSRARARVSEAMGREGSRGMSDARGYLRSVVYGFNDGLTANFGLVAGIIGASVAPHVVIITGAWRARSPTRSRWDPAATWRQERGRGAGASD